MLDGAAKQFDDGLYAAVDLACYHGALGVAPAPPDFVKAVFDQLPPGSAARPFLAGALDLADVGVVLSSQEKAAKDAFVAEFERDKREASPSPSTIGPLNSGRYGASTRFYSLNLTNSAGWTFRVPWPR